MTTQNTNGNKPTETLRDGAIKATIWCNEGDKGVFFTADISRTYTDAEGKPHSSHSFSGIELFKVAHLASKVYDRIAELRQVEKTPADEESA